MKQAEWKRLEIVGGEELAYTDEYSYKPQNGSRRENAWSRIGNGKIGAEVVFSRAEEQFGEKSMFNKKKYLVLARDIPVAISHYCCMEMKKKPLHAYQHKNHLAPILGTLAEESRVRKQGWIRHGCNAFKGSNPTSQPLSFWTNQDVLMYIVRNGVEICSVYGDVVDEVDGCWYDPKMSFSIYQPQNLRCTGCERTGQINAARLYGNI